MLNAHEIRIGNWIRKEGGSPMQATIQIIADIERNPKDYCGVELDDDWFTRFNLKKLAISEPGFPVYRLCGHYSIDSETNEVELGNFVIVKCTFVHDLQNFYLEVAKKPLSIIIK